LLAIPAQAGIHFAVARKAKSWITNCVCSLPFGPFAARMFASASCLRSPAFAGMTSSRAPRSYPSPA